MTQSRYRKSHILESRPENWMPTSESGTQLLGDSRKTTFPMSEFVSLRHSSVWGRRKWFIQWDFSFSESSEPKVSLENLIWVIAFYCGKNRYRNFIQNQYQYNIFYFRKSHWPRKNTIIFFFCTPKFCISIAFIFSWDHCNSQEKLETMFLQNFEGQTKSIMVFLNLTNKTPLVPHKKFALA